MPGEVARHRYTDKRVEPASWRPITVRRAEALRAGLGAPGAGRQGENVVGMASAEDLFAHVDGGLSAGCALASKGAFVVCLFFDVVVTVEEGAERSPLS